MGPETWITGELHPTLTPTVNPVRVRNGDNRSSCLPHPQCSQSRPPSLSPAPHPPPVLPAISPASIGCVFFAVFVSRYLGGGLRAFNRGGGSVGATFRDLFWGSAFLCGCPRRQVIIFPGKGRPSMHPSLCGNHGIIDK